jgi:tRNA(adenine34) deaminase
MDGLKMINNQTTHEYWMRQAITLAEEAARNGEVPVGAVVVCDDVIIGAGFNRPIGAHDPTAHAEIKALRQAAKKLQNYRMPGCTLYVTLEPCTMCVGAIVHARIAKLVFGAREPRFGAVASTKHLLDEAGAFNHRVQWQEGVLADQCGEIMQQFFRRRRQTTEVPE